VSGLFWILVAIWVVVLPLIGAGIASDKGRSPVGGFLITLFLGPIGLAIVLLLGKERSA
jgi:hypothetical protein